MKTAAIALLVFAIALTIFVITQSITVYHGKASDLSERDQKELTAQANGGDAAAAYRMYIYHSMSSRNQSEATKWLDRAAELGHTEAQRSLAQRIAKYGWPHQAFGKTPQEAVLKLLTDASKTNGSAACDLGELYYEGFFGQADMHAKAREAFQLAASLHCRCWDRLAMMLHKGEGGDADQIEAYYYICLDTQCTHPESVGGKELWVLRREIEEDLTLAQAKEVWKRVDEYITKERKRSGGRIYPPPLLGTGIPEKQWNEYLKTTDEFEARHRHQLETTMGEPGGARQRTNQR